MAAAVEIKLKASHEGGGEKPYWSLHTALYSCLAYSVYRGEYHRLHVDPLAASLFPQAESWAEFSKFYESNCSKYDKHGHVNTRHIKLWCHTTTTTGRKKSQTHLILGTSEVELVIGEMTAFQ